MLRTWNTDDLSNKTGGEMSFIGLVPLTCYSPLHKKKRAYIWTKPEEEEEARCDLSNSCEILASLPERATHVQKVVPLERISNLEEFKHFFLVIIYISVKILHWKLVWLNDYR